MQILIPKPTEQGEMLPTGTEGVTNFLHRPDQLLLEDDPAFLPDLTLEALTLDFPNSETPVLPASQPSNILSLPTNGSSHEGAFVPSLDLPSDTTGNAGRFALNIGETRVSNRGPGSSHLLSRDGEDSLLPEADFTFDAEGNIVEFMPAIHSIADPSVGVAPARSQMGEKPGVQAERESGQLADSGSPVSCQS